MSEELDPIDKLISEVQGKPIREPVPLPVGAQLAQPIVNGVPNQFFEPGLLKPDLTEPNRVILWYREIIRNPSGFSGPRPEHMSEWKQYKMVVSFKSLSVLTEKERENFIIGLSPEHGIGLYPKVLLAFEWYDWRLEKPLRQELKGGYVRG